MAVVPSLVTSLLTAREQQPNATDQHTTMDITDIVSTEYPAFSRDTPVSKLAGAFDDPSTEGVVITNAGSYLGVVTRRQIASSHHQPTEKVGSLVWHVPRVAPDEDARKVAQLMIDGDSHVLPVFEDETQVGVVTAADLIQAVKPHLDAATVGQAYTRELVTVPSEASFGEVIPLLREQNISHLPVVDGGDVTGLLSRHDVTEYVFRVTRRSQGGAPTGFDGHGGESSNDGYRTHGGFGAREGELARMLDLPVRNVMSAPVRTIPRDRTLADAVEAMDDVTGSSLVVVDADGRHRGILTTTDVLRSLTWGADGHRAVQIAGIDLLDDVSYDDVVRMVERFDTIDASTTVFDAKIHLHEHDETLRGRPLLLARIRLSTDTGVFVVSGEGFGARHAINEARSALERRIIDEKTYGRTKKHPDETYWKKRFSWRLEA